jgi:hypothetical protein
MPSTGATLPGSGTATSPSGGGASWTNPGNITADDNTDATLGSGAGTSGSLIASQFGFSISASAINGIEVTIGAKYTGPSSQNLVAQLRNASGTLVGSSKTVLIDQTSETTFTYGSSSDVWGTSLTQTDINDVDFGVEFLVNGIVTYALAVDWVKIDVTYTSSGGTGTRSYLNWFYGGMGAAGGAVANKFRRTIYGRVGRRGPQ